MKWIGGILIYISVLAMPLGACTWCHEKHEQLVKVGCLTHDGAAAAASNESLSLEHNARVLLEHTCQQSPLYTKYMKVYRPTAPCIISHYFEGMCPKAIDYYIGQISDILAHHTWFYFSNSPKNFLVSDFWECIVDQVRLFHTYLTSTYVRLPDEVVVSKEQLHIDELLAANSPYVPLMLFLKHKHMHNFYRLYGLYFDYLNKLFLEGVQFGLITQATRCKMQLQLVFSKLKGWSKEHYYKKALDRLDELLKKARARFGTDGDERNGGEWEYV